MNANRDGPLLLAIPSSHRRASVLLGYLRGGIKNDKKQLSVVLERAGKMDKKGVLLVKRFNLGFTSCEHFGRQRERREALRGNAPTVEVFEISPCPNGREIDHSLALSTSR